MICSRCGTENPDGMQFCKQCGQIFTTNRTQPQQPVPPSQAQPEPMVVYSAYPAPPYASTMRPMKKTYTWRDICTIIGFASSIIGFFTFWLVLCPVGLITSILGYRGDRTKGLAVAGIIISVLAILVKIGYILYDSNLLPHWLTSGVFW